MSVSDHVLGSPGWVRGRVLSSASSVPDSQKGLTVWSLHVLPVSVSARVGSRYPHKRHAVILVSTGILPPPGEPGHLIRVLPDVIF